MLRIKQPNEMSSSSCSNTDASHSDSMTAYSLLPTELVLTILAQCHVSPHLPTICRAILADGLKPGTQLRRMWLHRQIFANPKYDPAQATIPGALFRFDNQLNCRHSVVYQMESQVAYFFKTLAPTSSNDELEADEALASGMAPDRPDERHHTLVQEIASMLFRSVGRRGGKACSRGQAVVDELRVLRGQGRPRDCFNPHLNAHCVEAPIPSTFPFQTWRLVPDVFLLASLSIRMSHMEVLELCLQCLLRAFPSLATTAAPCSLWSYLMLDDRGRLRFCLSTIVREGDVSMTYPTFLCLLAMWDWSLPAISVVERVFPPGSVDMASVAHTVTSNESVFRGMLSTLSEVSWPSFFHRVVGVFAWIDSHNAALDRNQFPLLSIFVPRSYPTFFEILVKYDVPNLPHVPQDHQARALLGYLIVKWAMNGDPGALQVAMEHDLLDRQGKERLLLKAISSRDGEWAAAVLEALGKDRAGWHWVTGAKVVRRISQCFK